MMKDIVELLRNAETSVVRDDGKVDLVIHVAADEIERLRDALREIAEDDEGYRYRAYEYRQIASAALRGDK